MGDASAPGEASPCTLSGAGLPLAYGPREAAALRSAGKKLISWTCRRRIHSPSFSCDSEKKAHVYPADKLDGSTRGLSRGHHILSTMAGALCVVSAQETHAAARWEGDK